MLALSLGGGAAADAAERADPASVKHISGGTLALPAALAGGKVGGIATDASSGNVYLGVTRDEDSFVAVYDAKGAFVRHWLIDNRPLTLRLDDFRLAVGPDGNVYVAPQLISSTQDELIKVYKPDGTLVRTFGEGSHLFTVTDIEVDAAGNVFVDEPRRT